MTKRESSDAGKRHHYKLWVLAAIVVVALWSMLTGSVNLKWSAGNLINQFSDGLDYMNLEDLDVLVTHKTQFYLNLCVVILIVVVWWSSAQITR